MALTFTDKIAYPRRLVSASARTASADNFVQIPRVRAVYWRPETILCYDYIRVNTTANMSLYKTDGAGRGYGRKLTGVLWLEDSEVAEVLIANSHLNAADAATIDPVTNMQLRFKFNTGLNTNNFRYLTKTIQPVIFGVGWKSPDYIRTLEGAANSASPLIALPFRCMFNATNTPFNTTNVNAAGMYSNFSNT